MNIKFTQLPDKLKYPANVKGTLSSLHSEIVVYVVNNFKNTNKFKTQVVSVMNTVSYYIINGDSLPTDWDATNPLFNLELIDSDVCEDTLGNLYLLVKEITWDVEESLEDPVATPTVTKPASKPKVFTEVDKPVTSVNIKACISDKPTPKEYLYIKPPTVPQFDVKSPWVQRQIDGNVYAIYNSLPEVPTNQSQISVTTDINKMTTADLLRLFPNILIRTRSSCMYEEYDNLTTDPELGVILPINGFSPNQVRQNIIQYPHLFKLNRVTDSGIQSFYSYIEISGELHNILDVWDTLPDSRKIPKTADFIKEYVVRRYLLERDIKHIVHRSQVYGSLDPFLTLFATPDMYKKWGYNDPVDLATKCVNSRVSYKRTRNPIVKKVYSDE